MAYPDSPLPANPPPPPPPPTAVSKKAKTKKVDSNDAAKQLQAKIAQLELDQQGRTEEDAEIDREVRKANRELQNMLSSMDPSISKIDTLQKKYSELLSDMKRTEREHIKTKKRADQLQNEKTTQRSEFTKATTMKDKLEKLSRELTKENKKLKEDLRDAKQMEADQNLGVHRQIEQMVEQVEPLVLGDREQTKLSQIDIDRDDMFREKFKSFVEQYEMREIHFAAVLRTRDLELQYHIAQYAKLRKDQDAEMRNSHQLTRQVSTFSQTENDLRNQLNIYVEKFKQVEDTLNNSNDLFLTFRKEMEEMSKKTKRLEKENMNLNRKQEATNRNIFQMAEERSAFETDLKRLTRENDKLKKLCRAMQTNGYNAATAQRGEIVEPEDDADADADDDEEEEEEEEDDDDELDEDEDEDDEALETDSEYDGYDRQEYDEDTEDEQPLQTAQVATREAAPASTTTTTTQKPAPPRAPQFGPVPPPPQPPSPGAQQQQQLANGVNGSGH